MRKVVFTLFTVFLILAVSCSEFSGGSESASVRFGRLVAKDTVSGEVAKVDTLYWMYKATKADEGITYGQTAGTEGADADGYKAVSSEAGLKHEISGFAPGEWTFQLRGYLEAEHTNLIYQSDSVEASLKKNAVQSVNFSVEIVDGSKGNLKTVKPETVLGSSEYTVTCVGVYQGEGTVANITPATDGSVVENIKQGLWKLTYSFTDKGNNDIGSCEVDALILNGATTTVTLTYNGETASFKAGTVTMPTVNNWVSAYHTHAKSANYGYDETNHWLKCTIEGCDEQYDAEGHSFGVTPFGYNTCNTCGYVRMGTPEGE